MDNSTDSSTSPQQPQLPPGFRFHPTDEELVVHYLKKKVASVPLPVAIIADIDLYKFDPWELPAKAAFGEQEWYFFSPRDRKYPNGGRPNRAATSGYWKATGTDKPVLTAGGTQKVGVKKALVFYGGKPPKGVKTNWIMHEYRLTVTDHNHKSICKPPAYHPAAKNKASLRLDDWVLCRIYKKSNMQRAVDGGGGGGIDLTMNGIPGSPPPYRSYNHLQGVMRPTGGCTGYNNTMLENNEHNNVVFNNMLNSNDNTLVSTSNLRRGKRTDLPDPGPFWNNEGNTGNSSSSSSTMYTKMFFTDNNPNDGSPMETQPTATLDQTTQVAPGESIFGQPYHQLPDMNWYS